MLVKCGIIGEVEVMSDRSVYVEGTKRGEVEVNMWIEGDTLGAHQINTIERLMEDIRKPSIVLRDYLLTLGH